MEEERYWEIDFLRGNAVLGFVIFHTLYQLHYVFEVVEVNNKVLKWMPKFSFIFFLLLGISTYITRTRGIYGRNGIWKRFALICALAILITISTIIVHSGYYIYFGVLHCLAISTLIVYYLCTFNKWIIFILAVLIVVCGLFLKQQRLISNSMFTFWIYNTSIPTQYGHMFDYFPLLPHLGYSILGLFLGKSYYSNGIRQFNYSLPKLIKNITRPIIWIGRNSLWIYITHVPILFVINNTIMYFFYPESFINIIQYFPQMIH